MMRDKLEIGKDAIVASVDSDDAALYQHILDMGLTPGTEVTMMQHAPMGDPVEIRLRDYELTLRLADAARIELVDVHDAHNAPRENPAPTASEHPAIGECVCRPRASRQCAPADEPLRFALAGNQNCGKTTLFNQLTGSNQHVGNFPGVTGDRKDGRLIPSLAPFYKFMPYIMPTKNDACNQFEDCIEITNTDRWLRQKRLEGYKGLGYLHLFIAAYIRMVSMRPGINRFVAGRRIYARNNIEVVLTVRRSMSTTSHETTIKAVFAPTDTIFDVYRKMNEKIDEIKYGDQDTNTEQVAVALLKRPRFLLRFAIGCLRVMDYFGVIPQKLLDASPFHGSMIITDMGSLGIPPIYHHLYNFGNLPMFIAFGAKRKAVELDREGKPVERKYIDFMAVMDERVCDGYYYASSFKYMKMFMHNPALLEVPPEKVVEDLF